MGTRCGSTVGGEWQAHPPPPAGRERGQAGSRSGWARGHPPKEGGEEPLVPGGAAPAGNQLPVNTGFCGARPGMGQVSKQTPARPD